MAATWVAGQRLGHYRLLEQIGAGGMGVVYRVYDERLEREVALKVLRPGSLDLNVKKRLRKEALLLSKLNHPNVETVHDFDSQDNMDFLVVEYVSGETLDKKIAAGPLSEKEIIGLGTQLAEGLAEAHARGVLHLDLKPANLRLTQDGRLKILDFGLARLVTPVSVSCLTETVTEGLKGTLPYVSPEQLRGEEIGATCDIWAAGVVLFEMITGRRPFGQVPPGRLIDSILNEPPPSPRTLNPRSSFGIENVILKCLEKDPGKRYQSAKELLVDFRRLGSGLAVAPHAPRQISARLTAVKVATIAATVALVLTLGMWLFRGRQTTRAATPPQSLAVLPLENLSRDPTQEYVADGMTDALITELARIEGLRVISRQSVLPYKSTRKTLAEIATELHVDGVLEGSVLRAGGRVAINANLIDARDDRHLWGENYERDLDDVLSVRRDVAASIARELRLRLSIEGGRAPQRRLQPEANEAYLRARYVSQSLTSEGWRQALEYLRKAVARDPNHAMAQAALGETYLQLAGDGIAVQEAFPLAREAARRALEIEPDLPEGHIVLGWVQLRFDWDWTAAGEKFRRALVLAPGSAEAHSAYARYLISSARLEEAGIEMQSAKALDPLSPDQELWTSAVSYYAGAYDKAIAQLKGIIQKDPGKLGVHFPIALCYAESGQYDAAMKEMNLLEASESSSVVYRAQLAYIHARAGRRKQARRLLARIESAYQSAVVFAALGERKKALGALERAFQQHSQSLVWLAVDPRLRSLRDDPHYRKLIRRVNLASKQPSA